jgi:pilus assembly protein CpaB
MQTNRRLFKRSNGSSRSVLPVNEIRRLVSTRQGMFVVAGAVAVLSGAFLLLFLSTYRSSVTDTSPTTVLVAKGLTEKGSSGDVVVTKGLFETQTISKTELKDGAIQDPARLRGKVLATDVYPGEQFTAADLTTSKEALVNKISGNERAISVPLDSAHGMIGDIKAGDHVDVLAAFNGQGAGVGGRNTGLVRPVVKRVMENALVLRAPDAPKGGVSGVNKTQTVVLRAPDEQAWKFAFTAEAGKIWLVLRPKAGAESSRPSLVTVERVLFGTKPIQIKRRGR